MKKKLLFNIIALLLLSFTNQTYGQKLNLGNLESFLAYSTRGAVSNTNIAFVSSSFQGSIGSDLGAITGFYTPYSTNPHPGLKIQSSDAGNSIYDKALAQKAKEDLLNIYIHFCDLPVKSNAKALVFDSETLSPVAILIGDVGGVTRDLTLVGGGFQMKYLLSDLMVHLRQPLAPKCS